MEHIPLRRAAIAAEIRGEAARQTVPLQSLANAAGINIATLRLRLKGRRPFTTDELHGITKLLAVPLADVIERAEARP